MRGKILAIAVAIALSATIAAAPVGASERYSGKTAQKFRITIGASRHQVQLVRLKIRLRCRDGSLLFDDLSDFEPARLRQGGRFSDLQVGPSDEVVFRGRLVGSKANGKLRVRDKLASGIPCDSGSVGFAVKMAGSTSHGSQRPHR